MSIKTHYEILGVPHNATDKDIRNAYKKLALKHHPDKSHIDEKECNEIEFKKITSAYEILSDKEKKKQYDFSLQFGGGLENPTQNMNFNPSNLFNFFHSTNSSLNITIELTLEELYRNEIKIVKYTKKEFCTSCNGKGYQNDQDVCICRGCNGTGCHEQIFNMGFMTQIMKGTCGMCHGQGKTIITPCSTCKGSVLCDKESVIKLKIPQSTQNNESVILKGKGNQIAFNMYTDLVLTTKIQKHPVFERHKSDLKYKMDITLAEALSGFNKDIKFLDDSLVKIESNKIINPSTNIIIPNRGLTSNGKLVIHFNIIFPSDIHTFLNEIIDKNIKDVDVILNDDITDNSETVSTNVNS